MIYMNIDSLFQGSNYEQQLRLEYSNIFIDVFLEDWWCYIMCDELTRPFRLKDYL